VYSEPIPIEQTLSAVNEEVTIVLGVAVEIDPNIYESHKRILGEDYSPNNFS
jgi:hypothetical protein